MWRVVRRYPPGRRVYQQICRLVHYGQFAVVKTTDARFAGLLDQFLQPSYDPDFEVIETIQSRLERTYHGVVRQRTMFQLKTVDIDASKCITGIRTPSEGCRLLYNCVRTLAAKNVVEFGTGFGIGTMYLASACTHTGGHVYTIEPEQWRVEIAASELQRHWPDRATVYHGHAEEVFPSLRLSVDFGYIDAWHSYDVALHHFELLRDSCLPGGMIVLDDVAGFSTEMNNLWSDLVSSSDIRNAALWNDRMGFIMV